MEEVEKERNGKGQKGRFGEKKKMRIMYRNGNREEQKKERQGKTVERE